MDMIIFGGQSNMQGQTEALPTPNEPVTGAIEYRMATDTLIPLSHPVGEDLRTDALLGAHEGHGSLIPAFCGEGFYGLKVHAAALERGAKVTGATVHFVNEIPDGGEILFQKAVRIRPGDTPETLQRRVMEQAEWKLLPRAAELVSKQIVSRRN